MAHPSDQQIRQFLNGEVTGEALDALEAHLDGCSDCEPRLVNLARERARGSGQAAPGALFAQGSTISRFMVLTLVGKGAMGSVYAAFDPRLDRKVALKVLDAWADEGPVRQERMLAEARSLAKLNHPNVVTVHDAGVSDGVAWVAMEFVDGQTLGALLREAPNRSAAEVVGLFVAAGEGLAAAHALGVVHGDFKPSNVLVARDGRVRVTDFGLATKAGARSVGGTRAYQAPEAAAGRAVDARADQYSFARALNDALAASTPPARVKRALKRAMSEDPAARFTDLPTLLNELAPRRRALGGWSAFAAVVLAAVGAVVFFATNDPCTHSGSLDDAWGTAEQAQVRAAFARLDAPKLGEQVSQALTAWRASWEAAAQDACRAARRTGPGEPLTQRRELCLEERRREFAGLVRELGAGAPELKRRALSAATALSPPDACRDARALLDEEDRPTAANAKAELESMEATLVVAKIDRDLGRLPKAKAALEPLLPRARALGFRPVTAKIAFRLGGLEVRLGAKGTGLPLLEEAVTEGLAGRADDTACRAAVLLVYEAGVEQHQPEVGERWARLAQALLTRRGADPELKAGLFLNRSLVAESQRHLDDALEMSNQAVAALTDVKPTFTVANIWLNRARQLRYSGQLDAAEDASRRARALTRQMAGDEHPNVGLASLELGELALVRGDADGARAHFDEALALAKLLGPRHPEVGAAMTGVARATAIAPSATAAERLEALALAKQAWQLIEEATGPASEDTREALLAVGETAAAANSTADERDALRRLAAFGTPSPNPHSMARLAALGVKR